MITIGLVQQSAWDLPIDSMPLAAGYLKATIDADPDHRPVFAAGTVSASWLWFLFIVLGASSLRRWLTPRRRRWIDRASGTLLLAFAGLFLSEALHG